LAQVDELHREALPWLFRKLEQPRSREVLEQFITAPGCATFVATDAAESPAVGVLVVMLREANKSPMVRPARVAEIDSLAVDETARRRGVGRRLVQAALSWARDVQAERTELGVYEFNDQARLFWESMGFTTVFSRMTRHPNP
jgi:diamine N-acetyltransferase